MKAIVILGLLIGCLSGQTRRALVICNHLFDKSEVKGAKARADAAEAALKKSGFLVDRQDNVTDFRRSFEAFAPQTPTGGTSVVYFTGYGNRYLRKVVTKVRHEDGSEEKKESFVPASGIWSSRPRSEPWPLDDMLKPFVERSRASRLHFVLDCPEPCPKKAKGHQDGLEYPVDEKFVGLQFHDRLPKLPTPAKEPATGELPKNPQAGDEWMNGAGMTFCYCPPGRFQMGRRTDESPQNRDAAPVEVILTKGFWISKYELTAGDYYAIRKRTPSLPSNALRYGHLPLVMVKGPGAKEYGRKTLQAFEEKGKTHPSGWNYRLPTEAEWEYAARAGSETCYPFGDSAKELSKHANFAEAALFEEDDSVHWTDHNQNDGIGARTAPVGSYRPNAWGIHDMLGNVAEFVEDHYLETLPGGEDPLGRKKKGEMIVLRGGAWCSTAANCDPSFRLSTRLSNNDGQANWRGFRVVLAKP